MAQSTTNLGKIHVFPSETLYNQFKGVIADNDLALLKDDGAYIVAANLAQNGYVKFSNGLILQWGYVENKSVYGGHSGTYSTSFPIAFNGIYQLVCSSFKQTESYKGTSTVYAYTTSTVTFATYDGITTSAKRDGYPSMPKRVSTPAIRVTRRWGTMA